MRPARVAVLPFIAALVLSSCGGSGQATRPFGPGTLLSEARAAASAEHSAHFGFVIQGKLLHQRALPPGMSAGPYSVAVRGAVTSDDGGRADVHIDLGEPGVTISLEMREVGRKLYVEEPGGRWYSQGLSGVATSQSGSDPSSRLADRLLKHDGDWLIDVGTRRAGRKDLIAGDLDLGAISRDVVTALRQAHAPGQDADLVRYVIGSLANTSWTLTFDHRSHLIEGLRARAEMRFQSDILQKYGVAEPFGLPRAVTGLTITLAAHITHWGANVHVAAPAVSTPLPDPGLLRSAV
jgi:hypothetical protein